MCAAALLCQHAWVPAAVADELVLQEIHKAAENAGMLPETYLTKPTETPIPTPKK